MYKQIATLAILTALGSTLALAETPTRVAIAFDFGPITVAPGQSIRVCANNLYGEKAVTMRFLFLDALTGRPVAHQDSTLAIGQGACFAHDVSVTVGTAPTAPGATQTLTILLIPADPQNNWSSPFALGVSSGQLVDIATSKTAAFLPAVQRFNVVLPAVQ